MPGKKSDNTTGHTATKRNSRRKNATITITNGCFAGLEILLKKAKTSLGRELNCDICLDHSVVSNRHAVILKTGEGFILEDLGSRHGTMLNGKNIQREKLKNGDTVSIGNFELKFSC